MGSGRGDRNQTAATVQAALIALSLQWGPVVVTGIRVIQTLSQMRMSSLQWGPVVVTGIRAHG